MDFMNFVESLFRWFHVVAGIIWIGHLYFFNFVNIPFQATMDGDTKKKVNPELLPRALFWFRWGAALTWVTGVFLLLIVFYHGKQAWDGQESQWGASALVLVALTFAGVFAYDFIYKNILTQPQAAFWGGLGLSAIMLFAYQYAAGFGFRGTAIHLGALFGSTMAFNVWFRIWPAQQKIIRAVKDGQAPDGALVALAGLRSRHNTYMSVPLVFLMMNQHMTWAASSPVLLVVVVFIGWALVYHLYDRSAQVKGF